MLAKMNNLSFWTTHTDECFLVYRLEELLSQSGFTVRDTCHEQFDNYGFTRLWLLSESHLALHTFPERGKSYIELTSCVDKPFDAFVKLCDLDTTIPDC